MIELKDILRGLREQKQVSMDKMCEDLNNIYNVALAKSTISKWENGKAEPSLAYARILTKYFNVTLDYLLGLEKEEMYNFNKLSQGETTLLENFNKLNDLGKKEANKRVAELSYMPMYCDNEISATACEVAETQENYSSTDKISATKEDDEFTKVLEARKKAEQYFKENPHLIPIASHDKEGNFTEEDYKHDMDIMMNDDLWK